MQQTRKGSSGQTALNQLLAPSTVPPMLRHPLKCNEKVEEPLRPLGMAGGTPCYYSFTQDSKSPVWRPESMHRLERLE